MMNERVLCRIECGYCITHAREARRVVHYECQTRHVTLQERVEKLEQLVQEAMRTGDVCVLHEGGTVDGCAGCFGSVHERAETLRAQVTTLASQRNEQKMVVVKGTEDDAGCERANADQYRDQVNAMLSCICEHHSGTTPDQWGCPGCLFNWKMTLTRENERLERELGALVQTPFVKAWIEGKPLCDIIVERDGLRAALVRMKTGFQKMHEWLYGHTGAMNTAQIAERDWNRVA